MPAVEATVDWKRAHPGAVIGLIEFAGFDNRAEAPRLEALKRAVETRLRERYAGFTRQDFRALRVMEAYDRYYRRFGKTYHVLQQLESIVAKGKSLPAVSPLVDANFSAEVETLVLTAGHDAEKLLAPVVIDVARPGDALSAMGGVRKSLPPGDMVMRDAAGVACAILYGQDDRSPITAATTRVLYVAYAPAGVGAEAVDLQLGAIAERLRLVAPGIVPLQRRLIVA